MFGCLEISILPQAKPSSAQTGILLYSNPNLLHLIDEYKYYCVVCLPPTSSVDFLCLEHFQDFMSECYKASVLDFDIFC